jgi:hypothetical protein
VLSPSNSENVAQKNELRQGKGNIVDSDLECARCELEERTELGFGFRPHSLQGRSGSYSNEELKAQNHQ